MDITLAIITGIASAFMYSFIQSTYSYFQWMRTRDFFLSNIRSKMIFVRYHIMLILDVSPVYDEEESDLPRSDEEIRDEISSMNISSIQYEKINKNLKNLKNTIQDLRKDALAIPTFTSQDFHSVDSFIFELDRFLSAYSWQSDYISNLDTNNNLRKQLLIVIKLAEENPFKGKVLDKIKKWYWRRRFQTNIGSDVPF